MRASEWTALYSQPLYFHLYGDSLSSLQEIFVLTTKHLLVLKIKFILKNLIHRTSLGHVAVRIDITGNKTADTLAKESHQNLDLPYLLPSTLFVSSLK